MMKVSKTGWIFLIIGALLIAAASLGMARSQQTDRLDKLAIDLAAAKQKLNAVKVDDLIAQKTVLNSQLGNLGTQLQSNVSNLVSRADSISASNTLLDAAREAGVNVVEISSTGTAPNKLGEVDCVTLSIGIKVEGTLSSKIGRAHV
jgi:hypothetical protein